MGWDGTGLLDYFTTRASLGGSANIKKHSTRVENGFPLDVFVLVRNAFYGLLR